MSQLTSEQVGKIVRDWCVAPESREVLRGVTGDPAALWTGAGGTPLAYGLAELLPTARVVGLVRESRDGQEAIEHVGLQYRGAGVIDANGLHATESAWMRDWDAYEPRTDGSRITRVTDIDHVDEAEMPLPDRRDGFDQVAAALRPILVRAARESGVRAAAALVEAEHRGVMVALYPAADVAQRLAQPGGEPAANIHITLAYLGKLDELAADAVERAVAAVQAVCRQAAPLSGEFGGVGRFAGDDQDVVHATVDVPGLGELRVALCRALERAGVPARAEHGFDPHATLQYVDVDQPTTVGHVDPIPCTFDTVWVVSGDSERHACPLGQVGQAVGFSILKRRAFARERTSLWLGRALDAVRDGLATDRTVEAVQRATGLDPRTADGYDRLRRAAGRLTIPVDMSLTAQYGDQHERTQRDPDPGRRSQPRGAGPGPGGRIPSGAGRQSHEGPGGSIRPGVLGRDGEARSAGAVTAAPSQTGFAERIPNLIIKKQAMKDFARLPKSHAQAVADVFTMLNNSLGRPSALLRCTPIVGQSKRAAHQVVWRAHAASVYRVTYTIGSRKVTILDVVHKNGADRVYDYYTRNIPDVDAAALLESLVVRLSA